MLGERFNTLFGELVSRWETWWRAPRDPERVVELARARFALEEARDTIARERRGAVTAPIGSGPRTSVSAEDRARLAVRGVGSQQN